MPLVGRDLDLYEDCLLPLLLMVDDDPTLLNSRWLLLGEFSGEKPGDDIESFFVTDGSFMAKNFSEKV